MCHTCLLDLHAPVFECDMPHNTICPPCGHAIHVSCAIQQRRRHMHKCAVCRRDILDSTLQHVQMEPPTLPWPCPAPETAEDRTMPISGLDDVWCLGCSKYWWIRTMIGCWMFVMCMSVLVFAAVTLQHLFSPSK